MNSEFDRLFSQLATAWESHQELKVTGTTIPLLTDSWFKLEDARSAMWDWHRSNR